MPTPISTPIWSVKYDIYSLYDALLQRLDAHTIYYRLSSKKDSICHAFGGNQCTVFDVMQYQWLIHLSIYKNTVYNALSFRFFHWWVQETSANQSTYLFLCVFDLVSWWTEDWSMVVGKIAIAIVGVILTTIFVAGTVVLSLISVYIPNQSVAASGNMNGRT